MVGRYRNTNFKDKYMLFAVLGPYGEKLLPRAAFSSPSSPFFTIRTEPKPANDMFIFSGSKLVLQPITNGTYES